jgi:hypothetical protein
MTREKRVYLKPRIGEFSCVVNTSTSYSVVDSRSVVPNFFRNDTIIDIVNLYLWPLLYSRGDEVVSCATFSDWRRLFSQTINLAFPDYDYWISVAAAESESPATMSTFVPISDQHRTARILKYMTPARVLYLLTTRANFWPYGPPSQPHQPRSRVSGIFGLCSIKSKIKEYSEKTEIQWLVSSEFLRKMKRVHMYFTPSQAEPCVSVNDSDSDE